MIGNVIDNRTRKFQWRFIKAVIDPGWYADGSADKARDRTLPVATVRKERNGISVEEAISWANGFREAVTLYLHDVEAQSGDQLSRKMTMVQTDMLVEDYLREVEVDYVGLWQIVACVRDFIELYDPAAIRPVTLDAVARLIRRGLMPGDYTIDGFAFWNGDEKSLLERIEAEWDALPDGMPNLGDSCRFALRDT